MERVAYGQTDIMVSRLCWGTGLMSKLRHNQTPAESAAILWRGYELGVNFWDTADGYGTHPHVKAALEGLPRDDIVVNTKMGKKDRASAAADVDRFLQELGTDYIDTLLLHGVGTVEELEAREGALEALVRAREAGKVRAVGLSTHLSTGAIMDRCAEHPDIQVILTTVNSAGIMLENGTMAEHLPLVERCFRAGTGICLMKTLGQDRLAHIAEEAIGYNLRFPYAHSVCVGVNSGPEVEFAVRVAETVAAEQAAPLGEAAGG